MESSISIGPFSKDWAETAKDRSCGIAEQFHDTFRCFHDPEPPSIFLIHLPLLSRKIHQMALMN